MYDEETMGQARVDYEQDFDQDINAKAEYLQSLGYRTQNMLPKQIVDCFYQETEGDR